METKIYKVDDKEFQLEFTMLKPSKSLTFLIYVGKILGASAGKVAGAYNGQSKIEDMINVKDEDLNLEKMGDALFSMFERLDENEVIEKLDLLLSSVRNEGNVLHVDYFMFDGRPDLIFQVAAKALGVNYKRFLGENAGLLSKIQETVRILKNGKNSPQEQT